MSVLEKQLSRVGDSRVCPSALIVRNDSVLQGYRHYTPDKWKKVSMWISPGGRCDDGETVEHALRREVAEEVGITDLEIVDFIVEIPGAKEGDVVPLFFCRTNQDAKLLEPTKSFPNGVGCQFRNTSVVSRGI